MSILLNPPAGEAPDPVRLREENLTESFRQDLQLRGMAKTSIDTTIWAVQRYLAWVQARGLEPLLGRKEALLAYLGDLRARGLKRRTLQRDFSSLNNFYEFLMERDQCQDNPIPWIEKKYLRAYKDEIGQRKLISVEDAAKMVSATIDTRDRAILLLLLKTGIRRHEMITLDLADVNLRAQSFVLKPTAKRTNRQLFFDDETALALQRWLRQREMRNNRRKDPEAFFLTYAGARLKTFGVTELVEKSALRVGLHNSESERLEDRFTPHCCRHWFTTHLLRAGMRREYVQWLRGDAIKEAVDIYFHVDPEDVRRAYLACIPQLGV